MDRVNPLYIPRNHQLDGALAAAEAGDLAPFTAMLAAVSAPFQPQAGFEQFAAIPPQDASAHVTFCGT